MKSAISALVVAVVAGGVRAEDREGVDHFEKVIRPILAEHCYQCHSAKSGKAKGNLRLDSRAGWQTGGDSGPAVVAREPDKSPLVQAVRRDHKTVAVMPPDKALAKAQIEALATWVKRGAPAPDDGVAMDHKSVDIAAAKNRWPFVPIPETVEIPKVRNTNWPHSNLDRFILAALEARGLTPVGDATRRVLIRRATFDLTGLPPAPEEIDAFEKDPSPDAFAKVVDRLLASPHYGERWGRHWLDIVRYADTAGDNSDYPIPQMRLYRDWVIEAFNRDLPVDQFIRDQIAGDLIGGKDETERRRRTVATGYIANARRFGSRVDDYPQHLTIEDTIDNLGRTFLGLTINCARCHDHKFDPITMQDYYALYGFFHSTRYPWPGIELDKRQRDLVPLVGKAEVERVLNERRAAEKKLDAEIQTLQKEKSTASDKTRKDDLQKRIDASKNKKDKLRQSPLPFAQAYAVADARKIEDVAIQVKGNPEQPGAISPRRFLAVLGGQPLPADEHSSGRRQLADWIASPANPLTPRVFANRLWQYHFQRGLVATPNDFGKQGRAPTHPELLDFLARELIRSGWSIKAMHRTIMLSRTYRLASEGDSPGAVERDANDDFLWKYRRHRLDAESIRDALLCTSGTLDREPGGDHPFPDPLSWDFTQHKPFRAVYDHRKRSVYLMTQRIQRHPYLAIFDGPDTGASTANRVTSTTTLQSLYLLNDPFVHAQAKAFAARIRTARTEDAGRIDWAYRTALGRSATADETAESLAFLKRAGALADETAAWESLARAIYRFNEFVYID